MFRVSEQSFDPGAEVSEFLIRAGDVGAIVSFVGKVRAHTGAQHVKGLYLEHFAGVTEKSIARIERNAHDRWQLDDILIIHRVGELKPGEPIVLVCTASAHRRDAFEANDFLMDHLKTEALFWKKERREEGDVWIEPRTVDYKDATRWKKE